MDDKEFPTTVEKVELSDVKRALLGTLTERLSSSESVTFQERGPYFDGDYTELTFIALDAPDESTTMYLSSTRGKEQTGEDYYREIKVTFVKNNHAEVGTVRFEDGRVEKKPFMHRPPFQSGVVTGGNFDRVAKKWKETGGYLGGFYFYNSDKNGEARLGGEVVKGVKEMTDEQLVNLTNQIKGGIVNQDMMKSAVNDVREKAKPNTVNDRGYLITFITPVPE